MDSRLILQEQVFDFLKKMYIHSDELIIWQESEPILMGIDFYRKAVEFQHQYADPRFRRLAAEWQQKNS